MLATRDQRSPSSPSCTTLMAKASHSQRVSTRSSWAMTCLESAEPTAATTSAALSATLVQVKPVGGFRRTMGAESASAELRAEVMLSNPGTLAPSPALVGNQLGVAQPGTVPIYPAIFTLGQKAGGHSGGTLESCLAGVRRSKRWRCDLCGVFQLVVARS